MSVKTMASPLLLLLLLLPALITALPLAEHCCRDPSSDRCFPVGAAAVIDGHDGQRLQCKCELIDGVYTFSNCRSNTCEDSVSGERKKAGESVRYQKAGSDALLTCICAGVDGMRDCRTEEQVANEGKCKDQISGDLVPIGAKVAMQQSGQNYSCVCNGTNSYINCRSNMCTDISGDLKAAGDKVSVKQGGQILICMCAGVDGFKDCVSKEDLDNRDKCKDIFGKFANKGAKYDVKFGTATYTCVCDGNNSGKDCVPKA